LTSMGTGRSISSKRAILTRWIRLGEPRVPRLIGRCIWARPSPLPALALPLPCPQTSRHYTCLGLSFGCVDGSIPNPTHGIFRIRQHVDSKHMESSVFVENHPLPPIGASIRKFALWKYLGDLACFGPHEGRPQDYLGENAPELGPTG